MTLCDHVFALLWSVVHVVLENGIGAVRGVATQVFRGRRSVANSVPRILTIRFRTTVIGVVEGVEQTEVVAHLVGDGAVQITSRLEFSYKTKGVVKKHNSISGIPCWPEVEYGLAGYIQGEPSHAHEVAKKIRAGQIIINGGARGTGAPFGGYKASGNGREHGLHGLEECLETKAVIAPDA